MRGGAEGFEILLDSCRFSSATVLYLELALRQPVSFCGLFFILLFFWKKERFMILRFVR